MRVFPVKLTKETRAALATLSITYHLPDSGLAEDLFVFVRRRGLGLPSKEKLKQWADQASKRLGVSVSLWNAAASRRIRLFRTVLSTFIGAAIINGELTDPIAAVERILLLLLSLLTKLQYSSCLICELKGECSFGEKYGKDVAAVEAFLENKTFAKLIHPKCPARPEISQEAIEEALTFLESVQNFPTIADSGVQALIPSDGNAQQDSKNLKPSELPVGTPSSELGSDGVVSSDSILSDLEELDKALDNSIIEDDVFQKIREKGGYNSGNGTFTVGRGLAMSLGEQFVKSMSVSKLVLFTLAQKFSSLLSSLADSKFKPAPLSDREKSSRMKKMSDIPKIPSSTQALPTDIFSAKVIRKDALIREFQEPDERQKAFFAVLDASGSMNAVACSVFNAFYSRSALALAFTLALLERVKREKGVFFCAPFAGKLGNVVTVDFRDSRANEQEKIARTYLCSLNFDGGSTDIPRALKSVAEIITKAKGANKRLSESEILLITDAEDFSLTQPSVVKDLRKECFEVPINVLDLLPIASTASGGQPSSQALAKKGLESLADSYCQVVNGATSFDKMVAIVGGKKKTNNGN